MTNTETKIDTLRENAQMGLRKDFPALYWDTLVVVDRSTRLGIDDISYRSSISIEEDIETLQLSCSGWLETYDADKLANKLAERLTPLLRSINKKKTIVVFPGNGAQVVKDLLPVGLLDDMTTVDLPVQRNVDQNGSVQSVEIGGKTALREAIASKKAETIIVVDDAIATGATLTALRQAFPMRGIEWFGAAFMMLSPLQKRAQEKSSSGIAGYQAVIAPIVYQGISGTPALNSLSTLIGASAKSEAVRNKYMQAFVEDEASFLSSVGILRERIGA